MDILTINNLCKSFGNTPIINNLSFSVKENSVFGFIGKNGSGKTTTMKMILGFLKPNNGDIYVCGEKVSYGNTKTNRYIGYLPDVPEFYGYMKPKEYLKLCGEISGLNPNEIKNKSNELLDLVGLKDANKKIHGFSRGMKQRLGIAQALLNEPKLLICDEPTSALDPIGRKEILDILYNVKDKTTIILSTHILSDVERICDTIGVLDNGHLVLEGNLSKIKNTYRQDSLLMEFKDSSDVIALSNAIKNLPYISNIDIKENSISLNATDINKACIDILNIVIKENLSLYKYEILEPSLENVFLEVVK